MEVRLRRWTDADLPVLEACNTPEMTIHLAGPESVERVRRRHEQYVRGWDCDQPRMFTIRRDPDGVAVGSIGWWPSEWREAPCLEVGWMVLPEHQSRGAATAALRMLLARARAQADTRTVMACPHVDNVASNAVCRKAGFTPRGAFIDDYRGRTMTLNAWALDLDRVV